MIIIIINNIFFYLFFLCLIFGGGGKNTPACGGRGWGALQAEILQNLEFGVPPIYTGGRATRRYQNTPFASLLPPLGPHGYPPNPPP